MSFNFSLLAIPALLNKYDSPTQGRFPVRTHREGWAVSFPFSRDVMGGRYSSEHSDIHITVANPGFGRKGDQIIVIFITD